MLNPSTIYGPWDEGIVLDKHMSKSVFLGYNENGKEKFENTRTEIGELIYRFKYKNDRSCLPKIVNMAVDILNKWNLKEKVDIIIPVPPSNKTREYQPVFEISKAIAEVLGKECKTDILSKKSSLQVKDGYNISGTIKQNKQLERKVNILIIDDLYSTGATLSEVCKILKNDKNTGKIYCLVMTKTKG